MVVPETRDTIKFYVELGYKPTEMLKVVTKRGVCFRNDNVQCLSGTHGFSRDKRAFNTAKGADA